VCERGCVCVCVRVCERERERERVMRLNFRQNRSKTYFLRPRSQPSAIKYFLALIVEIS
jgi:hypothetical protein